MAALSLRSLIQRNPHARNLTRLCLNVSWSVKKLTPDLQKHRIVPGAFVTKGVQYLNKIMDSIVAGFQWATKKCP
ncbi:hypothetical protein scyTo_0015985 [Scyliorhinus torazame]|uniref:Uncharacterized protein n=1 Tax=Scyliorhinus torazame TaxID=75743 RepID=A0A401Q237_SCYTO|nr:hypothetical protein [Scyliorhinus torazame]